MQASARLAVSLVSIFGFLLLAACGGGRGSNSAEFRIASSAPVDGARPFPHDDGVGLDRLKGYLDRDRERLPDAAVWFVGLYRLRTHWSLQPRLSRLDL